MKFDPSHRQKKTVDVWNICTCGNVLHSLLEATRGMCGSCWLQQMPSDTKTSLSRLLAATFRPTSDEEKGELIDDAMSKLDRDRQPAKEDGDYGEK